MNKKEILALASVTLLCVASDASAKNRMKDRIGSNSFSSNGRGADSPELVITPPNGYPGGSMSTGDMGGNGFAARDYIDRSEHEADLMEQRQRRMRREARQQWSDTNEDRTVYHSAAPVSDTETWDSNRHFISYGEDIPALRGLQLEMAVNRLHHINRMEIDLAKMAESRAKSESVLSLAHQIRADHEKMESKVVALANRRGINLESFQLATWEQAVKDRLGKLSSPEFETAFLRITDRGHDEAAAQLRMVRNDISDTEVRGLINEALPQMAAHKHLSDVNKSRASSEGGDLGE